MIITKEMIEKVRPLAEENAIYEFDFENIQKKLSDILKFPAADLKYVFIHAPGHSSTISIELPNLIVKVYDFKDESFHYTYHLSDGEEKCNKLPILMEAAKYAKAIIDISSIINEMTATLLPEINAIRQREKIKADARWCFDRMNVFFIKNEKDGIVDTEKTLKMLWKQNEIDWYRSIQKLYAGKQESFKVMRVVIDIFYKVFQEIENKIE